MRLLSEIPKSELEGKKILLRVDFNFPIENGQIASDFRIKSHISTIKHLLGSNARIVLISHISKSGNYNSFADYVPQLSEIIGEEIYFGGDVLSGASDLLHTHSLVLMDNVRQHKEEEDNDEGFAKKISEGFDLYINDAFAVSHRKHALLVAITKYLPSYAGFVIEKETKMLIKLINAPKDGKTLVLGGAKIKTKLPVIQNFLDRASDILIGGAIVSSFLKAKGYEIGKSLVDEDFELPSSQANDAIINLPRDLITSDRDSGTGSIELHMQNDIPKDHMILDIGPESAAHFAEIIENSKMVIWNGPMGLFKIDRFSQGTKKVAQACAKAKNSSVGGGETIEAVTRLGLLDDIDHISTGGGAMLMFLSGQHLPGLEVLGYY